MSHLRLRIKTNIRALARRSVHAETPGPARLSHGIRIMRLALYQPDIAPNAGTMLRLSACMGVPVEIIEPCGFVLSDRKLKRAGMDYLDQVDLTRHASWEDFAAARRDGACPAGWCC